VKFLIQKIQVFTSDQRGATAIEYGLIAALIAVVIIGSLFATGTSLGELYTDTFGIVGDAIDEANG